MILLVCARGASNSHLNHQGASIRHPTNTHHRNPHEYPPWRAGSTMSNHISPMNTTQESEMAKPTGKKPEIVLKNIQHSAALSQETYAYSATVYVDGKRMFAVSNHGHGGGDMVYAAKRGGKMDWDAFKALEARIGETYPKWGGNFAENGVDDMDQNLEMVCHDLVTDWLIRKDLKSQLRRKLTYIRDGRVYECAGKLKVADIPRIRKMATWAKDVVFLNEIPFEEALQAWREVAA